MAQKQPAEVFHIERSVITKHIRNIFKSDELRENSVCANFAHTAEDGKSYHTQFYNLDMIILAGCRVNSKQGTEFRIWAANVLRKHLIDGYTINEKRLKTAANKYYELQKTISLLGNAATLEGLSDETRGIIKVIMD